MIQQLAAPAQCLETHFQNPKWTHRSKLSSLVSKTGSKIARAALFTRQSKGPCWRRIARISDDPTSAATIFIAGHSSFRVFRYFSVLESAVTVAPQETTNRFFTAFIPRAQAKNPPQMRQETEKATMQDISVNSKNVYKCTECGYSCKQPATLKSHMWMHKGLKPFRCTECDYTCTRGSHLKVHLRKHPNLSLFMCNLCSHRDTTWEKILSHGSSLHPTGIDGKFVPRCALCPWWLAIQTGCAHARRRFAGAGGGRWNRCRRQSVRKLHVRNISPSHVSSANRIAWHVSYHSIELSLRYKYRYSILINIDTALGRYLKYRYQPFDTVPIQNIDTLSTIPIPNTEGGSTPVHLHRTTSLKLRFPISPQAECIAVNFRKFAQHNSPWMLRINFDALKTRNPTLNQWCQPTRFYAEEATLKYYYFISLTRAVGLHSSNNFAKQNQCTVRTISSTKVQRMGKISSAVFLSISFPISLLSSSPTPTSPFRPKTAPGSRSQARGRVIRENWNLKYSACFVLCPLQSNVTVPHTVSIMSRSVLAPSNRLIVNRANHDRSNHASQHTVQPTPSPTKIGVCVKPLHFNYNQTLQLIEFIELNSLLGMDHITFYNDSISSTNDCILRHYMREGRVTVLPWKLDMVSQREIRTEGLFAALNDCLYRSMYDFGYVALIDLDEIVMPKHNDTIQQFIDWMGTRLNTKSTGSYSFQNGFFYLQWPDDLMLSDDPFESSLTSLRKTRRRAKLHPHKQRSKYICRPEFVIEAGNHFVWEFVPGHGTLNVPADAAILNHYRVCEFGGDDCVKTASVIDRTAFR
ncbi:unnamed protein product [Nesidiocoris tenuis]|uniref:C2H2-type domain-containing protein n=1 Tax=Nesidiocoris tenuis TaxID=355587 RepID=A0A6H5G399_9HEMI|nr:unnamed protein product [Nesidiocoris tenuis]